MAVEERVWVGLAQEVVVESGREVEAVRAMALAPVELVLVVLGERAV